MKIGIVSIIWALAPQIGDVAQMVERSLCMREARGSIPRISTKQSDFVFPDTAVDPGNGITNLARPKKRNETDLYDA